VIDEDAGQLLADRLVDEQRGDGAVDAAREAADHALAADLRADSLDLLLDHGRRGPGRDRAGDPVEEVLQDIAMPWGVCTTSGGTGRRRAALGRLERGDRRSPRSRR
jgi:hypothetical protein